MNDRERAFWVCLHRVEGIGPRRFNRVLQEWGTPEAAWQQTPEELRRVLGKKPADAFLRICDEDPMKVFNRVVAEGISMVFLNEEEYPKNLQSIDNPPPVLYYRGDIRPEDRAAVAIVGSRTATPNGLLNAEQIAAELAAQGVVIVSGLARGVDTAAHRGALAGGGRTIAVLGSGIDIVYPPENEKLAEEITKTGILLSEFPLGEGPRQGNFPARNRIISGLSLGVLVVEAARDSGSLITAGLALEQGREVFAVPGPIHSEACYGSNRLIRQGAYLVQSIDDILEGLNLMRITSEQLSAVKEEFLQKNEEQVMEVLAKGPQHIDIIVRDSRMAASEVAGLLVVLELKGLIQPMPGKIYRRIR
ncbi:MAG TPA: DNA-processing protein DprA [Bacillota bacterium]|nr:DNA-processing protein DprA [Bacillota bacterium]